MNRAFLERFGIVLLAVVILGTLELAEWVVLITGVPVPYLGRFMPYFGPLFVLILVFNVALAARVAPRRMLIPPDVILFAVFVAVLFAIELAHVVLKGGGLNLWLQMGFLWMFVGYVALRSFDAYVPRCREKIVAITVGLVALAAGIDLLLAVVLAAGWERAPLGLDPNQLFNSAYIAFLSAFGLALVLFDVPSHTRQSAVLRYGILSPLFIYAAYAQRLSGAAIMVAAIIVLKGLTLLRQRAQQVVMVTATIALATAAGFYMVSTNANPTIEGLSKGPYFLDEYMLIHGDIISSYVRRESIVRELRLFLESPIAGVGMNRAAGVQVLLSGMHSSGLYVLVASGLSGFALMALWLGWTMWRGWQLRGLATLALPAVPAAMMLLQTDPVWWWAIAAYLITTPSASSGNSRSPELVDLT